jgi:ADP-heptose:LPS heptosyltransferase
MPKQKKAAVIASGYLGDTIACSAAASCLSEKGYKVTFYIRWPQIKPIFDNDKRFKTVIYRKFSNPKLLGRSLNFFYDLIIEEPNGWSYEEPFTSQIRRIAGCTPNPEYSLKLTSDQIKPKSQNDKPVICIARDLHKRSYGRNIQQLVQELEKISLIEWVGLNPDFSSKKGKSINLTIDAKKIAQADIFIGPEGGLLWLSAGLGTRCIYFSEHIEALAEKIGRGNPRKALGSVNHFPSGPHQALPAYCSNEFVVEEISKIFDDLKNK